MLGIIAVLLVFGGLIFFHELGHFLVARIFSIGIKTFSLGFGPALFSFTRGKTTYQIAAIPLGGFVALVGESPDAEIPEPFTAADSFSLHPAWQRFLVAAAGSMFNLLLAWIICWGLLFSNGKQELLPSIGAVTENSPAAAAALQQGDIILTINGTAVSQWAEVSPLIRQSQGAPVTLTFTRGAEKVTATLTPTRTTQKDLLGVTTEYWAVGISPSGDARTIPLGFFAAGQSGLAKARDIAVVTWQIFAGLVSRAVPADNLGGPIGIAQMIYSQAGEGLVPLLSLAAFLSVNLGVLNLLPIPVLDGGHLFFLAFEIIFRRPVPLRLQERAVTVGLCLLLTLMLFATYNDIARNLKHFFG